MRILSAAAVAALVLAGAALPASAQEDRNLPGVRVTIGPSFMDPGTAQAPRTARDYELSNLTGNQFLSSNYSGVEGFQRFPFHDQLDLPSNPMIYVLRAPDRVR
ncbi:hypothetical protein [Terrihabitans rhizophilus]|jgi:hypothetical protein|uniref:Uncharacterized protein n=1 Tax=Terrihabitans rhizophilus TaxID=3092662 RepID=A0ABU4RMP6_9HYPH|nr:hypothetical protein [Terrihabitans sp. PJ23]MDX6806097.1 hypothetical protein [Terrihabitans sp. PJ23]